MSESKVTVLRSAYELLAKAQKYGIHPSDEVITYYALLFFSFLFHSLEKFVLSLTRLVSLLKS